MFQLYNAKIWASLNVGLWNFSPVCHSIVLKTAQEYELVPPDRRRHPLICSKASKKLCLFTWLWILTSEFEICTTEQDSLLVLEILQEQIESKVYSWGTKTKRRRACVCYWLPSNKFCKLHTWKPCLPLHHVVSSFGGMSITDTMSPTCREERGRER